MSFVRRVLPAILIATLVVGMVSALNGRASDNEDRIENNRQVIAHLASVAEVQQETLREIRGLLTKAQEQRAAEQKVLLGKIQQLLDRPLIVSPVRGSGGVEIRYRTRTRTVCRLPSGKPCK